MGNSECGIKRGGRESSSTKDFQGRTPNTICYRKLLRSFILWIIPKSCGAEGVEGASGKPPPRLRRGETLCNIKGTTAQFVGSAGDAFSAICFLQKSRFTSSKPSISAIASYKKCIRHRTNSFVRDCPNTISRFTRAICLRLFPSGVRSFHLA